MEHIIGLVVPYIIEILEIMGIFVVTWTALRSFWGYLMNTFRHRDFPVQYELASGMSTALAFKMAAEILKTVLVNTWEELAILGAVVILRGVMSILLHFELKHSKEHASAVRALEETAP